MTITESRVLEIVSDAVGTAVDEKLASAARAAIDAQQVDVHIEAYIKRNLRVLSLAWKIVPLLLLVAGSLLGINLIFKFADMNSTKQVINQELDGRHEKIADALLNYMKQDERYDKEINELIIAESKSIIKEHVKAVKAKEETELLHSAAAKLLEGDDKAAPKVIGLRTMYDDASGLSAVMENAMDKAERFKIALGEIGRRNPEVLNAVARILLDDPTFNELLYGKDAILLREAACPDGYQPVGVIKYESTESKPEDEDRPISVCRHQSPTPATSELEQP